jgi:hypothetical protein
MATKKVIVAPEFNFQSNVKNYITSTALAALTPDKGDRYILTDGANINNISLCTVGGVTPIWEYIIVSAGFICFNEGDNKFYKFVTEWVEYLGQQGPTGAQGPTGPIGPTGSQANLDNLSWQHSVNQISNNPMTANIGTRYIVGPNPTGVWVGHANEIAESLEESHEVPATNWKFIQTYVGYAVWNHDTGKFLYISTSSAGAWINLDTAGPTGAVGATGATGTVGPTGAQGPTGVAPANVFHIDVAGEIVALTTKTDLVDNDSFLIEDSEVTNEKKKARLTGIKATLKTYFDGLYVSKPVTYSRSFVISNPTTTADLPLWRAPANITITAIHLLCKGAAIVGNLWEYDANGLNGSTVDADINGIVDTNVDDDGSLSNPGIASGNYLGWVTASATAGATYAIVTFDYTIN